MSWLGMIEFVSISIRIIWADDMKKSNFTFSVVICAKIWQILLVLFPVAVTKVIHFAKKIFHVRVSDT